MSNIRRDLILDPDQIQAASVTKILEAVSKGYLAVDHRVLHAILDRPADAVPALVRFTASDHHDDPVDVEPLLIDLFRALKTLEAIPYLIDVARRSPDHVSDELVEALVEKGAAALEPLLALIQELGDGAEEVPFLLAVLRVRDPRILETLTRRLDGDLLDGVLSLDVYGDPAAIPALQAAMAKLPEGDEERMRVQQVIDNLAAGTAQPEDAEEPFDIWELYEPEDQPELENLGDDDRLAMLEHGSAALRAQVAESYIGTEIPENVIARLLDLAKNDPEPKVRGLCWESLGDIADEPEVRKAMLAVLRDPKCSLEERGGAAVALAQQADNPTVFSAIEALYEDPRSRGKALKAMARSFDRRFSGYPPKHLDDADADVRRQAIWGVGYLSLSSDAPRLAKFFDDDEFRSDAIFAYALSIPGETSRGRVRALLAKVDKVAGGLKGDEEELAQIALDQRLMLHGMKPVFFPDEDHSHHHHEH